MELTTEVYLMRHGEQVDVPNDPCVWQVQAPLSEPGRIAMMDTRQSLESGQPFFMVWNCRCSPLRRAIETLSIMLHNLDQNVVLRQLARTELGPISLLAWNHIFTSWPIDKPLTVQAAYEFQPGLLVAEGERIWNYVKQVGTEELPTGEPLGERALLVSHQPLIEMAVAVARNEFPPRLSLKKGEFVKFIFKNKELAQIIPPQ